MKIKHQDMLFVVIVTFLVGFIFGINLAPQPQIYEQLEIRDERVVTMLLPAVDSDGNGVVGMLFTTVKPGSGKILLDASNVLNYIDTQLSGRIAAAAASNYAKVNLSNIDIVYTIKVNASLIEGPSAGSAMAVSVLLALDNRTAGDIAMTGTIEADGTIGKVGAVLEKAAAARDAGTKLFLVPKGQLNAERSNRKRVCSLLDSIEICKITYKTENVDISSVLNITVREAETLAEAYSYFVGQTIE